MTSLERIRAIDANELENALAHFKGTKDTLYYDEIKMYIDDAPTVDAVEVVRCRDCKHFIGGKAIGKCYLNPDKPIIPVFYNHFCSYGERRDENAVD